MSIRKTTSRHAHAYTPLPPAPEDLAGWRWVRHEQSREIALAAPGGEYTTKWYLKDFDRAASEARRWLNSQPRRPLPADLPPVPNDLAGWAWEANATGWIRLELASDGLASGWATPVEADSLIAAARQIVAIEAERNRAALADLGDDPVVEVVVFDYAPLSAEARIVVQQATREIHDELDLMKRSAIKIGQRLTTVKAALPHGQWGAWLRTEFGWSDQTAANYRRQAELVAQNPKFLEFEDRIAPSARTLLADPATPEPARDAVIRRAEAGETVGHKDAKEIVRAAKAEQAEPPAAPAREPAQSAWKRRQERPASDGDESEGLAEQEASVLIVQLGGQYIGMTDDNRYRVAWAEGGTLVPYRLDELRRIHSEAGLEPPDMTPDPEPVAPAAAPPASELLDQAGRQPYGARGADRWLPIVPHVLIIEQRTHRYAPPPLTRAATIYDTPTTVRLRRPDGKEETQAQHKIWAVPSDQAWADIETAVARFGLELSAFADVLRDLGRYDRRLKENGGLKEIPDGPLCPSVARADDPDANNQSAWWLSPWHVPRLEEKAVARHTAKMLTDGGENAYFFTQSDSWLLADAAAWDRVSAAQGACKDAAADVEALLKRLGTYEEALADGRHQRPAAPPPPARPDGAPPVAVYEAAVIAFAARGYVLSCKARSDGQPGCPPYWVQRPTGRDDIPHTRGAGAWPEVEALLAEISAAPAPAADALTAAELTILESMEVGPPYWHRSPDSDAPPLLAMVDGNAPAQRALKAVAEWRALADERAALIRLARRLGAVVFGVNAEGLLRVRLDPDADEPQIAIALGELESLNLPDGWRWRDHADTTLQPERIADGHLGPIVGSPEEGGHYAYSVPLPGAVEEAEDPDIELPSESELDAQLLDAMEAILRGLPEPAVRVLAAQLCFDDVSEIAFSAPLERLYEGFREVSNGAPIGASTGYRRAIRGALAQLDAPKAA
jgi:hypothetical protein